MNQAWDYAHSTRLVRRFYFPCFVRPIYFFHLLRSLFPGYPSLPYLDGSRCRYMSRAPGSADSPGTASFFLPRVLRIFAISDKITSIVQVIIRINIHSQEALLDEVEFISLTCFDTTGENEGKFHTFSLRKKLRTSA